MTDTRRNLAGLVLAAALLVLACVLVTDASGKGKVDFMSAKKKAFLWDWYRSSGFDCIHRHEGSWRDPNPPYYGGFQMGMPFAQAYGRHYGKHISYPRRFGTPDHWPIVLQIHGARHGALGQGVHTGWPNTSRACGL